MVNMDDGGGGGLGAFIPATGPAGTDTTRDAQGGYGGGGSTATGGGTTGADTNRDAQGGYTDNQTSGADTNRDAQGGYGGGGSTTTGGGTTDTGQGGTWSGVNPSNGKTVYNANDPSVANVGDAVDPSHGTAVAMVEGGSNNWLVQMSDGTIQSVPKGQGAVTGAGTWGNGDGTGTSQLTGVTVDPTTNTTTTTGGTTVTRNDPNDPNNTRSSTPPGGNGQGGGGSGQGGSSSGGGGSTTTGGNTSSGGQSDTGSGSAQNWNPPVTDPTLGGYGDQSQLASLGGAVSTGNAPDGSVIVKTGDGSVMRIDPVTGKLTPWNGSVAAGGGSAAAGGGGAGGSSGGAGGQAGGAGTGGTGGSGTGGAGTGGTGGTTTGGGTTGGADGENSNAGAWETTHNGKTVYNSNNPAVTNVGQAVVGADGQPNHGTAVAMVEGGSNNWLVQMSDGTIQSVPKGQGAVTGAGTWGDGQGGGTSALTGVGASGSPDPTDSTVTGGAVTGGGNAKPPASVNTGAMPSPGTPAGAIGPGGTPTDSGTGSMQAPPGVTGPLAEPAFTINGITYWIMADGRVYEKGAGAVSYKGDYGTAEQAKAKIKHSGSNASTGPH